MSCIVSESEVEEAALEILTELGYGYFYGPDIAPETPDSQRATYSDVFLIERLRAAIATLNPHIPSPAREEALKKVVRTES